MKILLTDVCDFQGGTQPSKDEWINEITDGYIRMLQIRDFTQPEKNNIQYVKYTSKLKTCKKNDILIGRYGASVGKILTGLSGAYNVALIKTIPDLERLDVRYLFYYFNSQYFQQFIKNVGSRAAQAGFNKDDLNSVHIPLISLEEQRKIAEILDKVSDLIAKRKHQFEKLDLLVKSKFVEMFGDPFVNPKSWNIVVFSDIIQNANNGMARRGNDLDGDIVLRLVELQNGYIDYSSPNRIILNEAEKKRYRLLDKDFLFARVNGNPDNVGRCAVFNDIKDPVYHNDHIIRVHFNDELVNGTFLSVLLNSEYGKSEMRNKIKTSAGQYTISQDGIGAVKSILPPIKLQTQFAEFVQQTEHTKSIIKQSLEKLETLKKALMQEYFG